VDEPSASFGLVQLEGIAVRRNVESSIRFSKAYHPEFPVAVHSIPLAASFLNVVERRNIWQKSVERGESAAASDLDGMVTIDGYAAGKKIPVRP
jgi:hypothetical protein